MTFKLKSVKLPLHSTKHNSQSPGHHEADLGKEDNPKEETNGLTLNTEQEHPHVLRHFSTPRDPMSVLQTTFRLNNTSHSFLQLLNKMIILLLSQRQLSEKMPTTRCFWGLFVATLRAKI